MQSAEKYFRRFLKITPLGVAAWRSVEALNLEKIDLKVPVLDIGCGFGEFAEGFFEKPIDITGIDVNKKDIQVARKTRIYKDIVLADARKLPFGDKTFASVISISTLEHINEVEKVFNEVHRVLKPDGVFIFTAETLEVDKHTFYRPFLEKLKLGFLSRLITFSYNKLFKRNTLLSFANWELLVRKKFWIIQNKKIISPRVVKIYDIFIPTALPSQIMKLIFGKRIVFRPKFIENLLVKLFLKHIQDAKQAGTNLFIVAQKR